MSVAATRVVAATGMPTGDLPGVNFNQVFTPTINDRGNVGFMSNLAGPGYAIFDSAVWLGTVDPLNLAAAPTHGLIAAKGQVAPGTGGATYINPAGEGNVNDRGQVTFYSQLTGGDVVGSEKDTAQYVGTPGAVVQRFRELDAVPGAADGAVFNDSIFGNTPPRLGDGNLVAQRVDFRGENVGIGSATGIIAGTLNAVTVIARGGQDAPYGTPGRYSYYQTFSAPVTNDEGNVAFLNYLYDETTSSPTSFQVLFFRGSDGVVRPAVYPGLAVPDVGAGAILGGPSTVSINGAGQLAFRTLFNDPANTSSDKGVFVGDVESGYRLVARDFQNAPGLAGVQMIVSGADPLVNAQGQVLFTSTLIGTGIDSYNNQAVWLWSPADRSLKMVWREGNAVPDAEAGAAFGSLLQSPSFNAQGQVLIYAGINFATTGGDRGLYASEPSGGALYKVARRGESVTIAPGDVREINSLFINTGTGGEDGRASGLNDAGQIAYRATFTNNTSGVFVADTVVATPAPALAASSLDLGAASVRFSLTTTGNVSSDLSAGDVTVRNLLTGQTVTAAVRPTGPSKFELVLPRSLPDGNWQVTLKAATVNDAFGRTIDGDRNGSAGGDFVQSFAFFRGDMNNDGVVNNADIAPFVSGLTNATAFTAQYGYGPSLLGDVNLDGVFNNADIAAFVAKLTGARPAPVTVPPVAVAARVQRSSVGNDLLGERNTLLK